MDEYIVCRNCDSPDCKGCNLKNLETMLNNGKFDCMMNENHCINPSADIAPVRHGRWEDMHDYITKAQAIDIAESLRNIAGDTITNAFVKGIEGIKGGFTGFYDQNGKSVCETYHGTWHRTPKE